MTQNLFQIIAWFAAGAALGAVFLFLLSRTVAAVQIPGARLSAVAYAVLRFALAAGVLILAAQQGALPLLAALAGFLVTRFVVIRRVRGA